MVTKKDGAWYGPSTKPESPTKFLLKGTGTAKKTEFLKSSGTFKYEDPLKKDPIPKRTEQPISGITSKKNYITANAVEAILMGTANKQLFLSHLINLH